MICAVGSSASSSRLRTLVSVKFGGRTYSEEHDDWGSFDFVVVSTCKRNQ